MQFRSPWPCRLFLFDLDGTLIDSRIDIANSVSLALARMSLQDVARSQVVEFVGDGARKLIQRVLREAIGGEATPEQVRRGVELFVEEYQRHSLDTTSLYPCVRETLDSLSWAHFGVVTNKTERLSRQILEGLGVSSRFCAILGGDSTPHLKPHPAALREAMRRCKGEPHETVMVGDSPVDIHAGRAAGVITCGISEGFCGRSALETAGCDLILDHLSELPAHFCTPS